MSQFPTEVVREATRAFIAKYKEDPDLIEGSLGILLADGRIPPHLNPEDSDVKRIIEEAKRIHNS